jgi:glycerate 2-kinase
MRDQTDGRQRTWQILKHVVDRLDPSSLIANALRLNGRSLSIAGISQQVRLNGRVIVIAVGKASIPMACGALSGLGSRIDRALAVTKAGVPLPIDPPCELEVMYADHPVPAESSLEAGRRVREMVEGLRGDDVVLMLISGGGSALVEDLVEGVTLDDLRKTTERLLRAGATINELNAVRRRLSRLKGGRLARAIAPATIVNLIVSDVLGNRLQDIASGPTVQPPDLDDTLAAVLRRRDLVSQFPDRVSSHLEAADEATSDWRDNVLGTAIIADAETAARAAADVAHGLGYHTQTLGFDYQGEAREFGRTFGTLARHARVDQSAFRLPLALIGSGELTVTVRGSGSGGRNTEMALAAAREIDGLKGVTITSFATDGDDGTSGFAGGIVDGLTMSRARELGIDVQGRLEENDSAPVCRAVGSAIDIGPTGTNVNDLYLALIDDE